ncbi:T-cell differentiation antigen CD6-like isoform X3 [Halichondria panicea]|uniref:T-cell differentiation antigen CD6-like isoform X6 n=1 Tax=Halichondria panicea TaxID=6063 RepID=UPI00312BAF7C
MDRKEAPRTLINRLEQEHYRHSILSIGIIMSFYNYLKRMAIVLFISFALLATQVTAQAADCINSTLRLSMETDDGASIKGLPEYCFSGVWRRICMVNGEMRAEAETKQKQACKQLGYGAKTSLLPGLQLDTDEEPFVTIGNCSINAKSLQECEVRETTDCTMREQLRCNRASCPSERVRLVGGSTEHQGLVEVCSDGRWGTLHARNPTEIAREVCRRLLNGEDEANFSSVTSISSKPAYNCSILRGTLTCEESTYDNHHFHLNVSCPISNNSCKQEVRLTDGYSYREGRVEVCSGGVWRSVCNFGQEGIAGAACYQAGFPREGAMVTSYRRETTDRISCCCFVTNTNLNCISCKEVACIYMLGVVCQVWDHLQPANNASEFSTTPLSVTEFTSLDSTTLSQGTELVTSTQLTITSPDNNTVLFGAIIGVLFTLLLATLVGWMCTCIIMHRNNTTKSTSSTIKDPITTDDNYSLAQVIDSSYYEATPTKPPPTSPSNDATNECESKTQIIHVECATYDSYAGPNQLLSQAINPSSYNTVSTSDEGIGDYDVIDNNKPKQKPKPSNPPPVKVEASKGEDEFYNAEEHMCIGTDMKAKRDNKSRNAETDGLEENKTKKESVYSVLRPV